MTATSGLALGVTGADCGMLLFADPRAGVIGAAHAGWKGALTGVVEATVAAMERLGARRGDVVAALGPCIASCHPGSQGDKMSLTSAAVDLTNSLKTLALVWEEVREGWKDPISRDFEANHWVPLEAQVRAVVQTMDRLAPVLAKALRDCS